MSVRSHDGPLVSTDWLADNLDQEDLVIIDASWHLPNSNRNPYQDYNAGHIKGAIFFDHDEICDKSTGLPHSIPPVHVFEQFAERAGVNNKSTVIVYDNSDLKSAARLRWLFRFFGHKRVFVLDGGQQKWQSEKRPLSTEPPILNRGDFIAGEALVEVRTLDEMLANTTNKHEQVTDARAADRFFGKVPEPREGMRSGHMPDAFNVPFGALIDQEGCFKSDEDLLTTFKHAGVDFTKPVVTTCGSGITACVLSLALEKLDKLDVALYDGSWSEWGSQDDTPIEME